MLRKGRPVKITKHAIAAKCTELYWKKGIQNVTYNAAINYSGCSKGTVYKLFKSEDELHLKTLEYYYENKLKRIEYELIKENNVFDFIEFFFKSIDSSGCYYVLTNSNRNLLGKLSYAYVIKKEKIWIKLLSNLILRHINNYKIYVKNLNILSLAIYLMHNITLINIMKNNKNKSKDFVIIKEAIIEKISLSLKNI